MAAVMLFRDFVRTWSVQRGAQALQRLGFEES
jgi:hypothetical protein